MCAILLLFFARILYTGPFNFFNQMAQIYLKFLMIPIFRLMSALTRQWMKGTSYLAIHEIGFYKRAW